MIVQIFDGSDGVLAAGNVIKFLMARAECFLFTKWYLEYEGTLNVRQAYQLKPFRKRTTRRAISNRLDHWV